jgi:hypothetical protein
MPSSRRYGAVAVVVFVLACASASSALAMSAPTAASANNQPLITLYTQLIHLLEQEIAALVATQGGAAPPANTPPTPALSILSNGSTTITSTNLFAQRSLPLATTTAAIVSITSTSSRTCPAPAGFSCIPGTNIVQPYPPGNGWTPGFGQGGGNPPPAPTPPPAPAPYVAKAVHFDGSAYLSRLAGLNNVDGCKGSFSYWARKLYTNINNVPFDANSANGSTILYSNNVTVFLGATGARRRIGATLNASTNNNDNDFDWDTDDSVLPEDAWYHVLVSRDVCHHSGSRLTAVYINDVPTPDTINIDSGSAYNILYTDGGNPFLDALVRDAFAAVKRGDSAENTGDLPLVDVEIFLDGFGREEGPAAAGALGQLLQSRFRGVRKAHRNGVCVHRCTI